MGPSVKSESAALGISRKRCLRYIRCIQKKVMIILPAEESAVKPTLAGGL